MDCDRALESPREIIYRSYLCSPSRVQLRYRPEQEKRPRKCVVTSNFGMGGSKAQKKISNLKRKIRQQASKHVHSCKEKDLEIQELKLRERHHDIIFRDALRYIYHPYGNQRCIYYTNWDKEVADGFHSAYHEIDYR